MPQEWGPSRRTALRATLAARNWSSGLPSQPASPPGRGRSHWASPTTEPPASTLVRQVFVSTDDVGGADPTLDGRVEPGRDQSHPTEELHLRRRDHDLAEVLV